MHKIKIEDSEDILTFDDLDIGENFIYEGDRYVLWRHKAEKDHSFAVHDDGSIGPLTYLAAPSSNVVRRVKILSIKRRVY